MDRFKITPRKSLTLEPPALNVSNSKAFAAGYVDGDGHIGYRKSGNWSYLRIYVVGTQAMMEWLNDIMPFKGRVAAKGNVSCVEWSHRKAWEIHNYLWNPRLPLLDRKWDDKQYKIWSPNV